MDTGERLVSLHGCEGQQPVDLQPAGDVGGRLIVEGELLSPDGEGDGEVPVRLRPDLLGLDVIGREGRPPHEDPAARYLGSLGEDGDHGGHPGLTGGVVLMPLGH